MAKLYWRYKKDGAWTWKAADVRGEDENWTSVWNYILVKEEEE